ASIRQTAATASRPVGSPTVVLVQSRPVHGRRARGRPVQRRSVRDPPVRRRPVQSCPVASRHARSFLIHSLSCGHSSIVVTRRISSLLPGPASGARLAHSTASSLEATLRIQKPANSSLVSPYGPSVTSGGSEE